MTAPCGPAHVEELARSAQSRVYVQDGVAYGCVPGRRMRLGTRVLGATLAGTRLVLRAQGEELRAYDLRRAVRTRRVAVEGTVEAVRIDRHGLAVYVVRAADGNRRIRALSGVTIAAGPEIVPRTLRLARGQVAWRADGVYGTLQLTVGRRSGPSLLIRQGHVPVDAARGGLSARLGSRRRVDLGATYTDCDDTSQGCPGIVRLRIAGRFVAAQSTNAYGGDTTSSVTRFNLATGADRRVCAGQLPPAPFTLDESGRVSCGPTASG